jgi:hypothetical protein
MGFILLSKKILSKVFSIVIVIVSVVLWIQLDISSRSTLRGIRLKTRIDLGGYDGYVGERK